MGNSPSNTKLPATSSPNFHPEVEVIQAKSFNAHYGEVKVVRDKRTGQTYLVKDIVSNTKQAFEADLRFFSERVNVKHPNVVSVLGYTSEDKHNFCSTYYKISIFIEVLDHDLQKDFESRKAGKVYYTENELLTIADNLISGLSYFQSQGHSHGDIRPFNIFSKERTYKLSDPSLNAQKGSNGLTLAIIQGTKTLIAPELLQQVPSSNFEIKADKSKADVYSLGATLLALATLLNSEDAYDYKHGTISQNLIKERLQLVANRYSDFTYHLIKDMLIAEPLNRPDFVTLSNRLLPHQHEIRAGSHLTFFDQHHQHGDHHGYHHEHHDVHHHHHHHEHEHVPAPIVHHGGETIKRSALPTDVHHTPAHDDLDARIKAALERSAATFKSIETKEHYTPTYTHHTTTYTPSHHIDYTTSHHGEVAKSSVPVDTHLATTSHHTYVPPASYTTYTPSHHVDYTSTYTAPVSYTTHHTPVVDVHHGTDRSAEIEKIVRSSQHFGDTHHSYVAPTVDVHHSQVAAPTVDVRRSQVTTPAPVVDTHHSYVAPTTDIHHSDRTAEVERIVRASQHFAEPTTTSYSYTSYTVPASYTLGTTYTTPVVSHEHAKVSDEQVVRSTPKASDYTYTSTHGVPASYTTTTYTNGHHYTPSDLHYTSTSNVHGTTTVDPHFTTSVHGTGIVGGEQTVHHESTRAVEYHH